VWHIAVAVNDIPIRTGCAVRLAANDPPLGSSLCPPGGSSPLILREHSTVQEDQLPLVGREIDRAIKNHELDALLPPPHEGRSSIHQGSESPIPGGDGYCVTALKPIPHPLASRPILQRDGTGDTIVNEHLIADLVELLKLSLHRAFLHVSRHAAISVSHS